MGATFTFLDDIALADMAFEAGAEIHPLNSSMARPAL